jgi:tRNA 2-selenouridine synthase
LEHGDEEGIQHWLADMDNNIDRIRKRLGGLRHREIKHLLHAAHESGDPERNKAWIEPLLRDYYDPMYDYQIAKRSHLVVFRGSAPEVLDYLQHLR